MLFSGMVSRQLLVGLTVWSDGSFRVRATAGCWIAIVVIGAATGCVNVNAVLERRFEARQLAADLLVQFTKGADAANRAVMADTDEKSVAFAREAEQATQAVQKDIDALGPILQELGYADETRLLEAFVSRFAEYRALDRRILDLAVENSNLKAQRLSFGPAQEAADAFRDALEAVVPSVPAKDTWHVEALVATAVATVREIQVLQAPHIADADEAVMTRMEKRMATSETAARKALETLDEPRPACVAAAARRRLRRPGPVHGPQRSDHRPVPPQHQCAFAGAVAGPEADDHRRVRGQPARTPGRSRQARIHRQRAGKAAPGRGNAGGALAVRHQCEVFLRSPLHDGGSAKCRWQELSIS